MPSNIWWEKRRTYEGSYETFCTVCKTPLKRIEFKKNISGLGMRAQEETYVCKNGHVFSYEGLTYLKFLYGSDWM